MEGPLRPMIIDESLQRAAWDWVAEAAAAAMSRSTASAGRDRANRRTSWPHRKACVSQLDRNAGAATAAGLAAVYVDQLQRPTPLDGSADTTCQPPQD